MILESFLQSINEKTMPVNLDMFNDIDGNPFEYMVGAQHMNAVICRNR